MQCPNCGSSNLSGDVLPIDHESIEHAEILAEYNFCKDCGYTWFDFKEIDEKLKELHKEDVRSGQNER